MPTPDELPGCKCGTKPWRCKNIKYGRLYYVWCPECEQHTEMHATPAEAAADWRGMNAEGE